MKGVEGRGWEKSEVLITTETRVYTHVRRRVLVCAPLHPPQFSAPPCEAKKERKLHVRESARGGRRAAKPWLLCDIHVSRLFMTGGTTGRTRTTPPRNATRAPNTYIIRGKKRASRRVASRDRHPRSSREVQWKKKKKKEKKIGTTPPSTRARHSGAASRPRAPPRLTPPRASSRSNKRASRPPIRSSVFHDARHRPCV